MYQAVYRRRSDNDYDLMCVLGLDATPTDTLTDLGRSYFGGDIESFILVNFKSISHVVDVLEGPFSHTNPTNKNVKQWCLDNLVQFYEDENVVFEVLNKEEYLFGEKGNLLTHYFF